MPTGSRSHSALPAESVRLGPEAEGAALAPTASAGRLGRWLPRLSGLVRFAYRTGAVSAVCAAVLWWAIVRGTVLGLGASSWAPALGFLFLLLIPAGAAWLLGLTLHDLLTLPETLRQSAASAASASREALQREKPTRGGRIAGVIGAVWAARGFVLESRGAWAKAATAARLVRLAKLPFALGLVGLFALNGVVIAAGLLALVLMLV